MITLQCAICGKKERLQELYKQTLSPKKIDSQIFSARRTPDRVHHRFVKCLNCGLIFSTPILSPKKIVSLYKESTFDYNQESAYLKKTYGMYLKKISLSIKKTKISLVDIGCGNGFFLEEAKAMGIADVYGVEPSKPSVKKAQKWLQRRIRLGILKKGIFKKNNFDIVTCFHTLDHIIDPNIFLQNVCAILKNGGKVLFIVHDTNGLSVRIFGEKSPIFDIEHIFLFNKNNLTELFEINKFTVLETFPIRNTYPLIYWVRMMPIPKPFKNIMLFLLQKTKTATIPISLQAGNIGIIAQKNIQKN